MSQITKALTLNDLPAPPPGKVGWPWTEGSDPLPKKMPDGSDWPRISIVTPSYNQGQFIEETIRSVLLQGYPGLEYIVVDGDSADETVEIIKKYERALHFWISEPDQGQADALNKGFIHATGEICAYLNSDDWLLPDTLHKVARAFREQKCRWLASQVYVGESLESAQNWNPGNKNRFESFVAQQCFAQQGVFWRIDVLERPYFDTMWEYILDHDFFSRIFEKNNAPYILDELTAWFRLHPLSKTTLLDNILNDERKKLAQLVIQRSPSDVATRIKKECQRRYNVVQSNNLLDTYPHQFSEKIRALQKSLKLLVDDPYPWRDRIFWSATTRLILRLLS
ncbi:glycosyltransferase [Synechocystis sp. PCC 7339]|uniref:glycosyltransferase family 2 protein n=1 Tax=unclassified Synechocystis TaxID=2640012 RepID=UPI001BAED86F|nr:MULTISPECIES: glycosyltransferase family 2 protein [unclassified Synechocystis]QUS59976.1 glycosyltransferase [Synechocystis sp. PCC 7338]UAJ72572.1 glycosyltransferase [Synechocystis sp. PCC 7339]